MPTPHMKKGPPGMPRRASKTKQDASARVGTEPSPVAGKFLVDASDFSPGECVNCGAPAVGHHLLFCGERCRQIGELVRYARRKIADGTYDSLTLRRQSPAVEVAYFWVLRQARSESAERRSPGTVREVRWYLRTVWPSLRRRLRRPIHGATFRLREWHAARSVVLSLQHGAFPLGLRVLTPEQSEFAAWFDFRVRLPVPMVACDDPDNWPKVYRGLMATARAARIAHAGALPKSNKPRGR